MAKKKKQVRSSTADATSSDDSDSEQSNREDERGRTILAHVGKAIQNGTKIPLDWHPIHRTPRGDNRLNFTTYIGVVVRERVCITYANWKVVPKPQKDELYALIIKGFTVLEDRRKWILSRANDRWRAFKTRLRKLWLYKKPGKLRKKPPWKYSWITQSVWDKFKDMCTAAKFKEVSENSRKRSNLKVSSYRGGCRGYQYYEDEITKELLKKGIHIDQVPRHELWLRAHSTVKDGFVTFDNPIDHEIAEAINALKAQSERGEIVIDGGRNDIMARVYKNPEHGGRVRSVGSGITNTEYFGFSKPTPPSQLRAEMNSLKSELATMKNNQQFIMSYMMPRLNQEQLKQLMATVSQMGTFGHEGSSQLNGFAGPNGGQLCGFGGHSNGQFNGFGGQSDNHFGGFGGQNNDQFSGLCAQNNGQFRGFGAHNNGQFSGQNVGLFTQLLTKDDNWFSQWSKGRPLDHEQEVDPYYVPWPNKDVVDEQQPELHSEQPKQPAQSPLDVQLREMDYEIDPISAHILPKGNYDCCLAIEDEGGMKIVAIGQVCIPAASEVTLNHFHSVSEDYRRVSITKDIVPTALLPCPNDECTVVCQAKRTFVSWPTHLIFPKKKLDKQPDIAAISQSPSSQTSTSRQYEATNKDRAKVTSGLLIALKKEALVMKKSNSNILLSIPGSVFNNEQEVRLYYDDLLDWCYQREIGVAHISILMKHLSESCQNDGVSGMYGFCDSNYISPLTKIAEEERSEYLCRVFGCNGGKNINQLFFAPFHENRHWMLAAISPWNGIVFWLDPAGEDNEIREFAQRIINKGIIKFSNVYRKDIKKLKKNPIRWKKIQCPRQAPFSKDCGYYICRYMVETIANRRVVIPDEYFLGNHESYTQKMIDELRDLWVTYLFNQTQDKEDIEDNE